MHKLKAENKIVIEKNMASYDGNLQGWGAVFT